MTLWILMAVLLIAALNFLILPLYRESRRLTPLLATCIVFVVAGSAILYLYIGNPGIPSGVAQTPDVGAMVGSLASRLEENPDDVKGWQMLGRSYQTLKQHDQAIAAYEKAIELVVLLIAALNFLILPLYRESRRLTPLLATCIVFVVAGSAILYLYIGNPGIPSGVAQTPDVGAMVGSLASRLEENPDDVKGWQMLGRSYQTLKQHDQAIAAYEKAIELEGGQNSQTLVALALALVENEGGTISGRATGLLENALAIDPNNPNALFYSGLAVASRGNTALAADRWEILMGLNAPPEIRELLQENINEWRGVATTPDAQAAEKSGAIVSVGVSLSDDAKAELPVDATVFVIARDPAQTSPPIAVTRRRLSELPVVVELGDRDSMIPGRLLSAFSTIELVARVSVAGQAMAQPGDWFGSMTIESGLSEPVQLVVDQKVP